MLFIVTLGDIKGLCAPADMGEVPPGVNAIDVVIAVALASLVVSPLATLGHELGHAAAALRASSGPVLVYVGRPPAPLRWRFTRLQINWSPLPPRGVPFAGVCLSRRACTPRARLAVLLAGPAVTALLLPAFLLATLTSLDSPGWVPTNWGLSALNAFASLLYNIDPRPATKAERAGAATMRRDGPEALAEFRRLAPRHCHIDAPRLATPSPPPRPTKSRHDAHTGDLYPAAGLSEQPHQPTPLWTTGGEVRIVECATPARVGGCGAGS